MTTMTRKRTSASSHTAAAAAAATAIARCPTAGGITKTTEGPGDDDGDVEVRAVRVKDC
jgi:Ni,Fe-hydrogenase I small subunit